MGERTRQYDWSATALDTPDQWPLSLRTTVGIVLHSALPTLLFWGPDLLCFYNDAYRTRLGDTGKHPAVGKRGDEVWPEAWDFVGPVIEQVRCTGEPVSARDLPALCRQNGQPDDAYQTFRYSPVYGDTGHIDGILVSGTETSQRVATQSGQDQQQVLARQKAQESEAKLHTIISAVPAAMVLFVGRELIVDIPSQHFIDLIDRGPDVTGKPLRQLMPELESQSFLQILDEVYLTGKPYSAFGTPVDIVKRDGSTTRDFFNLVYTPLLNAQHQVYAILSIATNVTDVVEARRALQKSEQRYRTLSAELEKQVQQRTEELGAANEELAAINEELAVTNEELVTSNEGIMVANNELWDANNRLSRSNDNLEKFAYVASHDLQEPLRKIQSFGDLLKTQYADRLGDGFDHLNRMQSAASRMSTLIRDLLTFSRIATQRETVAMVPLCQVIRSVLTDLDLRIQETKATISVEPMPTIQGDRPQLEQLFQNLISNALKFRQAEVKPVVHVTNRLVTHQDLPPLAKPARLAPLYHRIDVVDNGIGFDEKYVDRIFQVFQRLHGKSEFAGTGIGLAICEKVVGNHGGAITATSQPGQGATFSLYFPV